MFNTASSQNATKAGFSLPMPWVFENFKTKIEIVNEFSISKSVFKVLFSSLALKELKNSLKFPQHKTINQFQLS